MQFGGDSSKRNHAGMSALDLAAQYGRIDVVGKLLVRASMHHHDIHCVYVDV